MGVTRLWELLAPAGKRITLESLEGKVLAIGAQQHELPRLDEFGGSLRNAHLKGLFFRICKLLYFGIRPVFVFDGAVPALKRKTIEERRKIRARKSRDSVRKRAEQLLKSQLARASQISTTSIDSPATTATAASIDEEGGGFLSNSDDESAVSASPPQATATHSASDTHDVVDLGDDGLLVLDKATDTYISIPHEEPSVETKHETHTTPLADTPAEIAPEQFTLTAEQQRVLSEAAIEPSVFLSLPVSIQEEIVRDLAAAKREDARARFRDFRRKSGSPKEFSQLQLDSLLKSGRLNTMSPSNATPSGGSRTGNVSTGATKVPPYSLVKGSLASDAATEYILVRTPEAATAGISSAVKPNPPQASPSASASTHSTVPKRLFSPVPLHRTKDIPEPSNRLIGGDDIDISFDPTAIDESASDLFGDIPQAGGPPMVALKPPAEVIEMTSDSSANNNYSNNNTTSDHVDEDIFEDALPDSMRPFSEAATDADVQLWEQYERQYAEWDEQPYEAADKAFSEEPRYLSVRVSNSNARAVAVEELFEREAAGYTRPSDSGAVVAVHSLQDELASECQQLLQHFGVPYVVSPSEAEAQCARLEQLGLVDGTITEDSDVFLFGGQTVLRHVFQPSRHVEQYTLADIRRLQGLDREQLIQLALLLGCDYAPGVAGIGTVSALEILSAFHGSDALSRFKRWVESPHDDTATPLKISRGRIKLPEGFPDPRVVEAFLSPQVSDSRERFEWGCPDLESLRAIGRRIGFTQDRCDQLLLPVVQRYHAKFRQPIVPTLHSFFPRILHEHPVDKEKTSKRLQGALAKLRAKSTTSSPTTPKQTHRKRKRTPAASSRKAADTHEEEEEDEDEEEPLKRRKKTAAARK